MESKVIQIDQVGGPENMKYRSVNLTKQNIAAMVSQFGVIASTADIDATNSVNNNKSESEDNDEEDNEDE